MIILHTTIDFRKYFCKVIAQKHISCGISYYLKCSYDHSLSKIKLIRGGNCIDWFIDQLNHIAERVDQMLQQCKSSTVL